MRKITFISLLLLSLFGCGEAPPPGRHLPPPADAASDVALPDAAVPAEPSGAEPASTLGFAAQVSGGVVAFDLATGRQRGAFALTGAIVDLHWDPVRRWLLVVERHVELDASHVVALRAEQGLTPVARSPWLTGQVRVYSTPSAIVAVALELSPSWWLLNDQLQPTRSSQSAFLPESWLSQGRARGWFALDTTRYEDDSAWDVLWTVQVDSVVLPVQRRVLPAPGRPESRLTHFSDRLLLARKHTHESAVELLSVPAAGLTEAPAWAREVKLPSALGSLESVVADASHDRALLLLSRPLRSGVLVDAPLDGGRARAWRLPGTVEQHGWLLDNPVVAGDTVWVAHSAGATRFRRVAADLSRAETLPHLHPPLTSN